MQVIKPMALGLSSRCIEYKRRLGLSITASLYFPFRPAGEGTVWSDMSMWAFLGKEMPQGPMIDEGVLKTTPEYLVHGHAQVPGKLSQGCEVIARVGALEKKLHVFGKRQWQGREIGPIEPFASVPLDWQHAYGGVGCDANPVGMGRPDPADPQASRWIPQVIRPQAHPRHPQDEVTPEGFRALDCTWADRARRAGTYDEAWMKQHMPGFAPDIDWRYFNLAPADQWFSQPLRGDEAYEFVHMHPNKAQVGGVLPGLRVRCFTEHERGRELKLREVSMSLTTLWFFPHAERGVMLFQGLAPCEEDDGTDIQLLVGGVERLDEPREPQHYLEVVHRRRDPQWGSLHALREGDLLPSLPPGADPDFEAAVAAHKLEGLTAQAQARGARLQTQQAVQQAQALGVDPATLNLPWPRPEVPSLETLPDYLMKHHAQLVDQQVNGLLDVIEQQLEAKRVAEQAGLKLASLGPKGPPQLDVPAQVAALRASLPPGTPFDAAGVTKGLEQAAGAQRLAYLHGAHEQAPMDPLPPEQALALRARVQQALQAGDSLAQAQLMGADLSGLDLSGADFTGAWLEGANLRGAKLCGAGFSFAVLARADLRDVDATEADFMHANLGGAQLSAARFVRANLMLAILHKTDLNNTDLRHAHVEQLKLLEARFGRADWRGIHGRSLSFIDAKLQGMLFTKAQLTTATFVRCDFSGVDFQLAELVQPTFVQCKGVGSLWRGARLTGAVFTEGCDFSQADFREAQLLGANLRGTRLAGAVLTGACLDDADLSACDATGADARGASMRRALMIKSHWAQARMAGVNMAEAIAQRADLRGADLSGAQWFGSDVSRVRMDTTTTTVGLQSDRAKIYPRWSPPA